jgi:hypothetical protein
MLNWELARSIHEERVQEIEAEYRWRAARARMRSREHERDASRPSMLRRLASVFVTFSLLRSR